MNNAANVERFSYTALLIVLVATFGWFFAQALAYTS
jgi:hypothetical protein